MAYFQTIFSLLAWHLCAILVAHASVIPAHHSSCLLRESTAACPYRTFDYIIVGGGNAGITLAARLSEDPDTTVAIIEAGGFYEDVTGNQSQIPANDALYNSKSPEDASPLTDWMFETTPQDGANGVTMKYQRAKTLGGCTALNFLAYQPTTAGALQKWADDVGDDSWAYDNVAHYYEKTLNFTPPDMSKRRMNSTPNYDITSLGDDGGPLDLTYPNYAQPFSTWISKGLEAVGILPTDGFTSGRLSGSSWIVNTINQTNGFRDSAETALLSPNLGRPNLVLFKDTLVENIIFDDVSAEGVRATFENDSFFLGATKEVILSAGAIQSPQLLMVSGVGPAVLLEEYGIDIVADRTGVGQNLQDNPIFGIDYRVDVTTSSALLDKDIVKDAIEEFNDNASGPLSSPGGDFSAFEHVPQELRANFSSSTLDDLNRLPADWPELEYFALPAYVGDQTYPYRDTPRDGYNHATLMVSLMAPFSRGSVSISSDSIRDQPVIDPNWMTAKTDIEVAMAAFKRVRQILETPVLQENLMVGEEYFPGKTVATDEEILETIKGIFYTMSHATSTCKMGRPDDDNAVVDPVGRVYGTEKLRVVDASIFPFLPPGLPMATVYMVAEKIADEIKNGN